MITTVKTALAGFLNKFLRETLYQRLLWRGQKKTLHGGCADYMQNHSSLEENHEIERKRLLNHILISEDTMALDKLSNKAKYALTVKHLTHILYDKKIKVIKDGFLTKEGQKTNKNIEERYVRLTRNELQWFHSKAEAEENEVPLGSIKFTDICSVITAERKKQTSDLFVECTAWRKKRENKDRRKFAFGAKDDIERDDWITSIEYLRLKNVFENFTKNYAHVALPMVNQTQKQKKLVGNTNILNIPASLGTSIKRKAEIIHHSFSSTKKVSSNRKSTVTNLLMDRKRTSSFSIDSFQIIAQENIIKEVASKIKKLYNANFMHFLGQISENSFKRNPLNPNAIQETPDIIKPVNFFEDLNLSSVSISRGHEGSKKVTASQKVDSPVSMKGQIASFKNNSSFFDFRKRKESEVSEALEMKKVQSERPKSGPILEESMPDVYNDNEISSPIRKLQRLPKVQEEDDEQELTMDAADKAKKNPFYESDFSTTMKDRSATFKPYNYRNNSSLDDMELSKVSKPLENEIVEEVKHLSNFNNNEDGQKSYTNTLSGSSDEENERQASQKFIKARLDNMPVMNAMTTSHVLKRGEKLYIEEEKSDYNFGDLSLSSKSRYSMPDSEKHDHIAERFNSRPIDIEDPLRKPVQHIEKISKVQANNQLSISRMQYGINRFQNAGKDSNPVPEPSPLNVSQKAKDLNSSETRNRRNSPYNVGFHRNHSPLVETTQIESPDIKNLNDSKRKSNFTDNSVFSDINMMNNQTSMNSTMVPYFGSSINQNDMNSQSMGMNPFMMQMMTIMQQNAELIAQQQEILKSHGSISQNDESNRNRDLSKTRSHNDTRPASDILPNYTAVKKAEQKTLIDSTDIYSDINEDQDVSGNDVYDPENIRAASISNERNRKRNVESINPTFTSQQRSKVKKERPQQITKKLEVREEPKIYEKAQGIVMYDVSCRLNPDVKLSDGSIVTVERFIPELDLYQCRLDNHVGMYPKDAIKVVRKKGQKQNDLIGGSSVERRMKDLETEAALQTKQFKKVIEISRVTEEGESFDSQQYISDSQYQSRKKDSEYYESLVKTQTQALPTDRSRPVDQRISKEGDFARMTSHIISNLDYNNRKVDDEDQMMKYYEPKIENYARRKFLNQKSGIVDNMFGTKYSSNGSDLLKINDDLLPTQTLNYEELKLPNFSPKKGKKSKAEKFMIGAGNEKKRNDATMSKLSTQAMIDRGQIMNPSDSVSSTTSANKSLKMKMRKENRKKNKHSQNPYQGMNLREYEAPDPKLYRNNGYY